MALDVLRCSSSHVAIVHDRLLNLALGQERVTPCHDKLCPALKLHDAEDDGPDHYVRDVPPPRCEASPQRGRVEPLECRRPRTPVNPLNQQVQDWDGQELVVEGGHTGTTEQREERDDADPIAHSKDDASQLAPRRRRGVVEEEVHTEKDRDRDG